MDKLYSIEKSPLYKLKTRKKLIELLGGGVTYLQLEKISSNTTPYYRSFQIENDKGKVRDVAQCLRELAFIQKKIQRLLRRVELPSYLYSKRKCSVMMNAELHQHASYVFTIDLKNFYPNCTVERLASSLSYHFKQSGDIARLIANLLTLDGKIPQGSTTSSNAAFIANKTMFDDIYTLCSENKMNFSVFVDDLTISFENPIELSFRDRVISIIRENGLPISYNKIKYFKKNQVKHVTGLVVNENQIKIEFKKYKKLFHKLLPDKTSEKSARGLYQYIKQVDPSLELQLFKRK